MEIDISNQVVNLNVGGKLFTTTVLTLTKDSVYFKNLFKNEYKQNEVNFIDRDGEIFSHILQYCRIDIEEWLSALPSKRILKLMKIEAKFYVMDTLQSILQSILDSFIKKEAVYILSGDSMNKNFQDLYSYLKYKLGFRGNPFSFKPRVGVNMIYVFLKGYILNEDENKFIKECFLDNPYCQIEFKLVRKI